MKVKKFGDLVTLYTEDEDPAMGRVGSASIGWSSILPTSDTKLVRQLAADLLKAAAEAEEFQSIAAEVAAADRMDENDEECLTNKLPKAVAEAEIAAAADRMDGEDGSPVIKRHGRSNTQARTTVPRKR
jgi:hypothetical protein